MAAKQLGSQLGALWQLLEVLHPRRWLPLLLNSVFVFFWGGELRAAELILAYLEQGDGLWCATSCRCHMFVGLWACVVTLMGKFCRWD